MTICCLETSLTKPSGSALAFFSCSSFSFPCSELVTAGPNSGSERWFTTRIRLGSLQLLLKRGRDGCIAQRNKSERLTLGQSRDGDQGKRDCLLKNIFFNNVISLSTISSLFLLVSSSFLKLNVRLHQSDWWKIQFVSYEILSTGFHSTPPSNFLSRCSSLTCRSLAKSPQLLWEQQVLSHNLQRPAVFWRSSRHLNQVTKCKTWLSINCIRLFKSKLA